MEVRRPSGGRSFCIVCIVGGLRSLELSGPIRSQDSGAWQIPAYYVRVSLLPPQMMVLARVIHGRPTGRPSRNLSLRKIQDSESQKIPLEPHRTGFASPTANFLF